MDFKKEIKSYPIIDVDILTRKDPSIPDSIKNSMVLYNKALDSIEMGNDDMAIIKLKKAISMYPSFYEAMNLLGIIYIKQGEIDKASEIFQRVITAESNSIKAQNYISTMNGADSSEKSGRHKRTFKMRTVNKKELKLTFGQMLGYSFKKDFIKYILGIGLGIIIGFSFSGNEEIPDNTEEIDILQKAIEDKTNLYENLEEELLLLKSEKGKVDEINTQKDEEAEILNNSMQIFEIDDLVAQNKIIEAAKSLVLLKGTEFTIEAQNRFNYLYTKILSQAATLLYNEAKTLLQDESDNVKALENLKKVEEYAPEFENPTGLLYLTGKAYMLIGDYENAKINFKILVDKYPNYENTSFAKIRLNEILRIEEN